MRILVTSLIFLLSAIGVFAENPPPRIQDEGGALAPYFNLNCVGNGITCTTSGVSASLTFSSLFLDNEKLLFGTGSDSEIYYDGTNMVINPIAVGTGYLWIGDGSTVPPTGKMRVGTMGLGDSAPANVRPITMDVTGGTMSAGLASTINYTGATVTMRAMLFEAQHAGTSTTSGRIAVGGNFTGTIVTDTTGGIQIFGVNAVARSTVALANTSGAGQATFQNQFNVTSVGGNTTTQPIYAYSIHAVEPGNFTGAAGTLVRLSGLFSGKVQVNSDKTFALEGSDTVEGDSYLVYNTAAAELQTFVGGAQMIGVQTNAIGFFATAPSAQYATASVAGVINPGGVNKWFDDTDTDGGLGGSAYTIGDVVAALKLYGLLAP